MQTQRVRTLLRARLGDEIFSSWFATLEIDRVDGDTCYATVPVKFLQSWIQRHYVDDLLACCQVAFRSIERVDVGLRQPGRKAPPAAAPGPVDPAVGTAGQGQAEASEARAGARVAGPTPGRLQAGGFTGSPLDPRLTLETFVVGPANRMAHAAATQVAETVFSEKRSFNPLYIHSSVGLGKTHLLHAIAWEVRRRFPHIAMLYVTAERFRYEFVDALQSKHALQFKERFQSVDMLLMDDLEFLQGNATELEFDHIINALLDGGKQLVVASSRAPSGIDRLNERMRSRLQGGLVVEIGAPDYELRYRILERRIEEKRLSDPSFQVPRDVVDMLAERLTESGRELEGAATRLHAHWQCMQVPITSDVAESVIRDLMSGIEPRRIRVEDILKVVSRHYGVSRGDILSQRRHRSVVWPRQIGMYLAKQMTARSLPEIGRRFGNRDHTTVIHAIRKVDGELTNNHRLREEIEELKKLLLH
ncbi:MAG: chromosomal replication initiator protein DnaA [Hyphomicrobiaceae bacterium]